MRLSYQSDKVFWRNTATRAVLVLLSVALIVWFLPRNQAQHFIYSVGKPWLYGSLYADFDFPVYKSDEAKKAEEDSIAKTFQPYFNYNAGVETEQLQKFHADFEKNAHALPKEVINIIADRLHHFYQTGIINTPQYNKLAQDTASLIKVVSTNQATSMQTRHFYSTISAYEQLMHDEALQGHRVTLQRCNLNNYIEPNLLYDSARSQTELNDLLSGIAQASDMIYAGQKIIDRGDMVDEQLERTLSSLEQELTRRESNKREIKSILIGQILYVTILVALFTIYLTLFKKNYFDDQTSNAMLYMMIIIFPILVSLLVKHNLLSIFIIPFAMVPIFVRTFMDENTAFMTHVTMVLLCAVAVKYQYEFIIIELVAGMVAIYSLRKLMNRSQIFLTALLVTVACCLTYFALQLIQNSHTSEAFDDMYKHFIASGILLLLSYPFMLLIEKVFGFVSDVTLFELSNTNKGLLRQLSEEAPGTFQHSITVGNLAAEVANKIGADSLLVRTGALYHDIGKMKNPVYFTENQAGVNPLQNINEIDGAKIITNHVTDGIKLAEENNIPDKIKAFISTHHGNGVAKYFYIKYKNEHPDEEVDRSLFAYPGPNPETREQALLMMCDAVEAASRSLQEYSEKNIRELIDKIIDKQVSDGFFSDCRITFRDIKTAKETLTRRLMSIYHTRIQYPELKKDEQKTVKTENDAQENTTKTNENESENTKNDA